MSKLNQQIEQDLAALVLETERLISDFLSGLKELYFCDDSINLDRASC